MGCRKRVSENGGGGSRLGEGGCHACPHHLRGARTQTLADAGVQRGREPRPSELEVLDPRPELFMGRNRTFWAEDSCSEPQWPRLTPD